MPAASLVIPTHNRAAFLARTLTSLCVQDTRDFEVVIVDDGSTDATRDVARSFGDRLDIRYLRRAQTGISRSRNAAMREATGDIVISTDDDRIGHPSFVSDHVAAHVGHARRVVGGRQRGLFAEWSPEAAYSAGDVARLVGAHPEVAARLAGGAFEIVSAAMIEADLAGVLAAYDLDELWWASFGGPVVEKFGSALAGFHFPWTMGIGGNTSVRRAFAEEVGLLDERFVGWGLEDTEFHYRLHRAGATTIVADRALNYHQVHRRGPERRAEWAHNAARFLAMHDSLDVILYLATYRAGPPLLEANRILAEVEAIRDAAPAVVAELTRVHRDRLRLALGA